MKEETKPPPVPRQTWVVAGVIVAAAFMTQLDAAILQVALLHLSHDFEVSVDSGQWLVTVYLLATGITMPLSAWLCRRCGPATIWLWSLIGFTLTSAGCAAATGIVMLLVFRALQGAAAGAMLPAGQSVIVSEAGPTNVGRVMGIAGSFLVLAPALGPVVGSELVQSLGWRSIFLVNVPIGVAVVLIARRITLSNETSRQDGFPWLSWFLVAAVVTCLTLASEAAAAADRTALAPELAVALLFIFLHILIQSRIVSVVKFSLLRDRTLLWSNLVAFLAGMYQFGILVYAPIHLQLVSHLSLSATGLAMTSFAIGSAFLAYAGKIVDQKGGGAVTVAGSYGLLVVAIAQLAGTRASSQPWWTIVALLLLSGITLSSIIVPSATAAYAKINKPDVPDAVALNNLLLRVGGAVGSAVIIQLSLRDQSGAGQLVAIYLLLLAIAVAVAAQLLRQSTPYRRN